MVTEKKKINTSMDKFLNWNFLRIQGKFYMSKFHNNAWPQTLNTPKHEHPCYYSTCFMDECSYSTARARLCWDSSWDSHCANVARNTTTALSRWENPVYRCTEWSLGGKFKGCSMQILSLTRTHTPSPIRQELSLVSTAGIGPLLCHQWSAV